VFGNTFEILFYRAVNFFLCFGIFLKIKLGMSKLGGQFGTFSFGQTQFGGPFLDFKFNFFIGATSKGLLLDFFWPIVVWANLRDLFETFFGTL